ncbi:hypothetical protein IWQ60_001274 [Tieghemiomyces parasiticus]|uniref:COP9 signalosome complex subunit 2 n=1 Tax=Tieghemiomyces parasiticus TaxID=78921 RepID=A0A9W8AKX5_9FUNG|nr:hypothetical protein IWQ60_001274 [Tieghemiomyces parasiticus]
MSDDDDFMLEDEDYDFDYEDDDDQDATADDPSIALENAYYRAKGLKDEGRQPAIVEFEALLTAEAEPTEWGFKALKQLIKLYTATGDVDQALACYERLFNYTASAVTRNYSEKSINGILDRVSAVPHTGDDEASLMERFYATTLRALESTRNERLWIRTNLKLARLWLAQQAYSKLAGVLQELRTVCEGGTDPAQPTAGGRGSNLKGDDDQLRGTFLQETYALEIQLYTATQQSAKLKDAYRRCVQVRSAIPHPRIMGTIYECGGKMYMDERNWARAQTDFFESFKNYDEAGSPQRIQVLKYLVLASMLSESQIDPFASPETKPYKNDPEVVAMTNLVAAYQKHEINEFERHFRAHEKSIMADPFVRKHMDGVVRSIRSQVLVNTVKPYTCVDMAFLAESLNTTEAVVQNLLVVLICDGKLDGYINQVNGTFETTQR